MVKIFFKRFMDEDNYRAGFLVGFRVPLASYRKEREAQFM
jgi:hypothetical protein